MRVRAYVVRSDAPLIGEEPTPLIGEEPFKIMVRVEGVEPPQVLPTSS